MQGAELSTRGRVFVRLPFSVNFGWVTVATIANITVWLVIFGWDGSGIADATWAVAIIASGAVIGTVVIIRDRDTAYGLYPGPGRLRHLDHAHLGRRLRWCRPRGDRHRARRFRHVHRGWDGRRSAPPRQPPSWLLSCQAGQEWILLVARPATEGSVSGCKLVA